LSRKGTRAESVRVLQVTQEIGRRSFGLGQVVVNLAKVTQEQGCVAKVWCLDTADEADWAIGLPEFPGENVSCFTSSRLLGYSISEPMLSAARTSGVTDVVHQHGIWTSASLVTRRFRRLHHLPTVIAPHGALAKWALQKSRWKKRVALAAYERENLQQASCLHAMSDAEVRDFRDCGLSGPIALIPNGVSQRLFDSVGSGVRFRKEFGVSDHRRIVLFLSRITPKKGLLLLLEAMHRVHERFPNVILVVAGPNEFGHLRAVKSQVTHLELDGIVCFTGPLFDQAKRDAFAASDVFVLPSYSEGSPMVVLECLAAGVPVITTHGTTRSDLRAWECGWWVEISPDAIARALAEALTLSEYQLAKMGHRGREMVESSYLWGNWLAG